MGDLSKHFSRREFACKCGCGFDAADIELVDVLEDLRRWGGPVTITGPNRCEAWNAQTPGASPDSTHVKALGADVKCRFKSADEVADYLEQKYPDKYGIGRYKGRTHIDVKPGPARRWDYR